MRIASFEYTRSDVAAREKISFIVPKTIEPAQKVPHPINDDELKYPTTATTSS